MSSLPNVVLQLNLTPHDLTRRTLKAIAESCGEKDFCGPKFKIGELEFRAIAMESSYEENKQLSASEGDIVLYELVTYGYGENIAWDELQKHKDALDTWAKDACERFKCDYKIVVAANYW